jgi:hypothetical protein
MPAPFGLRYRWMLVTSLCGISVSYKPCDFVLLYSVYPVLEAPKALYPLPLCSLNGIPVSHL